MKKIIILLLVVIPNIVFAYEYTDYQEYLMGVSDYYDENDLLKREEYKEYNTYEVKKKYLDYQDNCSLYDEDDYVIEKSISKSGVPNEGYNSFYYDGIIDHIEIINYNTKDIRELVLLHNGKKIDFRFENDNDKIFNEEALYDNNKDTYANVEQFAKFRLYFEPTELVGLQLDVIADKSVYFSTFRVFYRDSSGVDNCKRVYAIGNHFKFETKEDYENIVNIVGMNSNKDSSNIYYINESKKYHCYELINEPTNNYVLDGDNLIEDDYHIKYNYYKRDYIKEEIEFTNNDILEEINEIINDDYIEEKTEPINKLKRNSVSTPRNNIEDIITTPIDQEIPIVQPLKNIVEETKPNIVPIYLLILLAILLCLYFIKRLSKK